MTLLAILVSVAGITVAALRVWNTTPVSNQRLRLRRAVRARRERRELENRIASFASEPALIDFEARYDELWEAYGAKQIPDELRVLWAQVFQLAGESPVGRPFQYGPLAVHQEVFAMTVRKGSASITGRDWLEDVPIPAPPRSAVNPPSAPIPVIKE